MFVSIDLEVDEASPLTTARLTFENHSKVHFTVTIPKFRKQPPVQSPVYRYSKADSSILMRGL
jgi:hypothetical protein